MIVLLVMMMIHRIHILLIVFLDLIVHLRITMMCI